MFVKDAKDYDAKKHIGRKCGAVSIQTRGEVRNYVALKK